MQHPIEARALPDKIKSATRWIAERLLYPFKYDLLYTVLMWGLLSTLSYYHYRLYFRYIIYLALFYFGLTYLLVCLLNIHRYIGKILKPIFFVCALLFFLLNLYCLSKYGCLISYNIIEIIRGTNLNEIQEYMEAVVSLKDVMLFLVLSVIGLAAYVLILKIKFRSPRWLQCSLLIVLGISALAMWHNPSVIKDELINSRWLFNRDEVVDLRNHLTHPHITIADQTLQSNRIVIIIGESFSPSHSSLYGYGKSTNPLLEKRQHHGDLFIFNQVTSPATHTTEVFKYLLNTYLIGAENQHPWYDSISLIEVLTTANYHTCWISNQPEIGLFENLPSGHAKICDESHFTSDSGKEQPYDEVLIDCEIPQSNERIAVFYHLMGQHPAFNKRYPKAFDSFKASDYHEIEGGGSQLETLAHYDNATLYNDYVVNKLIDKYKDTDAIIFYFADHGLDLYETDPTYAAHAKQTPESQAICKKIPFMVYLSPQYQQLRPDKVQQIRQAADRAFCTDKLIYAVMDVVGLTFSDNDDVARNSLFSIADAIKP